MTWREDAVCEYCEGSLTDRQRARRFAFCSRSCASRARGAEFRGIACYVESCGGPVKAKGLCDKHYQRMALHGTTQALQAWRDQSESERFWSKVRVGETDECWEWGGERCKLGYGRFYVYAGGSRRMHLAHRYVLADDGVRVDGLVVRHSCDNPPCVNPAHLTPGSQLENVQDAIDRGRINGAGLDIGRRMRTPTAKLSDTQVLEIRGLLAEGWKQVDIAARYGVGVTTISGIKNGRIYRGTSRHERKRMREAA